MSVKDSRDQQVIGFDNIEDEIRESPKDGPVRSAGNKRGRFRVFGRSRESSVKREQKLEP